eukprot:1018171-Prorocentrum_minimum.AAC.1
MLNQRIGSGVGCCRKGARGGFRWEAGGGRGVRGERGEAFTSEVVTSLIKAVLIAIIGPPAPTADAVDATGRMGAYVGVGAKGRAEAGTTGTCPEFHGSTCPGVNKDVFPPAFGAVSSPPAFGAVSSSSGHRPEAQRLV